jgi:hypothetical protein
LSYTKSQGDGTQCQCLLRALKLCGQGSTLSLVAFRGAACHLDANTSGLCSRAPQLLYILAALHFSSSFWSEKFELLRVCKVGCLRGTRATRAQQGRLSHPSVAAATPSRAASPAPARTRPSPRPPQRPLTFSRDLPLFAANTLPFAVLWHAAFAVWAFSLFGMRKSPLIATAFRNGLTSALNTFKVGAARGPCLAAGQHRTKLADLAPVVLCL